jgi:3-deoxy-D-manno-octulosonic acid kinase
VSPVCGPVYRGWLVTKELRDAQDLWAALQNNFVQSAGLAPTLKALAVTLRALHREGVYHADLNLKNILVREEAQGVAAHVIDFDRARLFLGDLPAGLANKNLARLLRSIRKLDPQRKYFSAVAWNEFLNFYNGGSDA